MAYRKYAPRRTFPLIFIVMTALVAFGLVMYVNDMVPDFLRMRSESGMTIQTQVTAVVEPTVQPVVQPTAVAVRPTVQPPAPTAVGGFNRDVYIRQLQQGIFDEMLGRKVNHVFIIDGRPQGESRSAVISYHVTDKTALSDQNDWVTMFRVISGIMNQDNLDLDVITLMPIIAGGGGSGVITTTTDMLNAYMQGDINRSEFVATLELSAF